MTNEQIQALKAAAEKCTSMLASVDTNMAYAHFMALVEPEIILSLLAEREADKALISFNSEMFRAADRDIAAFRNRIAELEIESSVKDASILELKQQYQRLLEARTITVELPEAATEGGKGYRQKAIWVLREACVAAGVNLEIKQ